MSLDHSGRLYPDGLEEGTDSPTERFTIYDLLKLPEEEQRRIMDEAFALASTMDIEIFDTYDDMDFNDEAF